jgi:hypothetical protein
VSFGVPPYKATSNRWPVVEIISNVASLFKNMSSLSRATLKLVMHFRTSLCLVCLSGTTTTHCMDVQKYVFTFTAN